MTKSYYLKYRPQKVAELDLKNIREQLESVLASERVPHAWLFTGPKGTGKTSSARIVAKSINCLEKKTGEFEPCNQCEACKVITKGESMDILEIDAASNRGIDDIRELRERIKLSPSNLNYKVYIIDEVHMLTTEAFNALLKTLEEPPEHAVFVLCTTEEHKIPETIKSRCLQFQFRNATLKEVKRSLSRVVEGEEIKIKDKALDQIAQKSGGSFRDAVKVLEQLSFENKKISQKEVEKILGESGQLDEFLKALKSQKVKPALAWVSQKIEQGADFEQLGKSLLSELRQAWLSKNQVVDYQGFAVEFSQAELRNLIELVVQHLSGASGRIEPALPLEMVAVDWCGEEDPTSPEASGGKESQGAREPESQRAREPEGKSKVNKKGLKTLKSNWGKLLKVLKPKNHSITALLKAAQPANFDGETALIEVFYEFHKSQLESDRCRRLFEEALKEVLGNNVSARFQLGEKPKSMSKKTKVIKKEKDLADEAEEIFSI